MKAVRRSLVAGLAVVGMFSMTSCGGHATCAAYVNNTETKATQELLDKVEKETAPDYAPEWSVISTKENA